MFFYVETLKRLEHQVSVRVIIRTLLYQSVIGSQSNVSIRSTPYCISQKNIVPLHGGIISLILRQKNAI